MIKKILLAGLVIGLLAAIGIYVYISLPHRDVQATAIDFEVQATALVEEFITDAAQANARYLTEDGDSKVLAITGRIASIEKDGAGLTVIYLKNEGDNMGVSCTFTLETESTIGNLQVGDETTIKGVIRSGAEYDEDLDLYEDVIVEKCAVI